MPRSIEVRYTIYVQDATRRDEGPVLSTTRMSQHEPISQGSQLDVLHQIRGAVMPALAILSLVSAGLTAIVSLWFAPALALFAGLFTIGLRDLLQTRHSLLRNLPVLGRLRFILESSGPELHQCSPFSSGSCFASPFPSHWKGPRSRRGRSAGVFR